MSAVNSIVNGWRAVGLLQSISEEARLVGKKKERKNQIVCGFCLVSYLDPAGKR